MCVRKDNPFDHFPFREGSANPEEMDRLERKVNVPNPTGGGGFLEGRNVDIIESTERFCDLKLSDGTILKIKPSVIRVARLVDQWDNQGDPMYVVSSNNVLIVAQAPPDLKKSVTQEG